VTISSDSGLDEATAQSVLARLEKDNGLPAETGKRCLRELLRFLDLAAAMRANGDFRPLVPSANVDAAWHALILHTRPYMELCERRYGEYLHHDVTPPADRVAVRELFDYLRTRVLMEKRYGTLDEDLWPLP